LAKPHRIHILGKNRLLSALPKAEHERLLPKLVKVALPLREILVEANEPISRVFFPLTGVVSLVIVVEGGVSLEVGTIGNEGMVGIPVFLGSDRSPTRAISQVPGEAYQMESKVFEEEMRHAGHLHGLIQRYTQAMINQISQSTVCNHRHSVQKRMCRWLLMSHDRVGVDDFPLTQEFLAQMLGVRRPTVTTVARILQKTELISYRRGKMTILDRKGLEAASCECYGVVTKELDRLLG
jgi:CRP-like cAMP-binding protein